MRNLTFYSTLYLLAVVFLSPILTKAQEADSVATLGIFDLLQTHDVAQVSVKSDLSYLVANKKTADDYIEGTFTFETPEEVSLTLPVKVKCRGRYRRMKCEFPPFKLKFKKDDLAAHGLNEFNELKLVTHCIGEKEQSKNLIMRELLTYKLYNILTPNSFRVQLVRVSYLNTKGKPKKIKGWGILIEDSDELAHRMGGEKFMQMGLPPECYNREQEKIAALFNYMIGNCDWNSMMARNIEFIRFSETDIKIVPYDFDFAGLVNAPYAVPSYDVGQKTIKDRVYLGQHCTATDLVPTFKHFIEKKEEIIATIDNAKLLSSQSKVEMKEYLDSFYQVIEDEDKAQEIIFNGE